MLDRSQISKIIDLFESVLCVIFFTGMFGAILIQVFFRYVLQAPLIWPYELSIYCYIFIVFLGAAMAARRDSHIAFGIFFERLPEKIRLLTRIITNILVIILFISIFPSNIKFMKLFGTVTSSSLEIPMYLVFAALPFGIGLIILYLADHTFRNFRKLLQMRKT